MRCTGRGPAGRSGECASRVEEGAVRARAGILAFVGSVLLVSVLLPPAAVLAGSEDESPDAPSRVIIIVLDQTRKDTIARYGMQNVQDLMSHGVSFPNAYL